MNSVDEDQDFLFSSEFVPLSANDLIKHVKSRRTQEIGQIVSALDDNPDEFQVLKDVMIGNEKNGRHRRTLHRSVLRGELDSVVAPPRLFGQPALALPDC
jgi:hypothetical protein